MPRIYLATKSQSRYSLLGAFATQLAAAMQSRGLIVNPDPDAPAAPLSCGGADSRDAYIFFNHLDSVEQAHAWAGGPDVGARGHGRAIIQWCVDHPLTIEPVWLERMSQDPGFRLLTVTSDDAHLLSVRFPALKHAAIWHGVDDAALCDPDAIEPSHAKSATAATAAAARDIDIILAGSIASAPELARLKARVPAVLHACCEDIVQLLIDHPGMAFGQAIDHCLPSGVHASDHWRMMQVIFAYTAAAVGRIRRAAVAQAMQGLNTLLIGTESWKEFATGTLKYAPQLAYEELPTIFKRAKVALAVSPPQFATGFSERILLSMAAGCATVAEERLAITDQFASGKTLPVQQYPPNRPELARILVGKLLSDPAQRAAMGAAGRATVAQSHLWSHRVAPLLAAAGIAMPSQHASAIAA